MCEARRGGVAGLCGPCVANVPRVAQSNAHALPNAAAHRNLQRTGFSQRFEGMKKTSRENVLQLRARRDGRGSFDVDFAAHGRVAIGILAAVLVIIAFVLAK